MSTLGSFDLAEVKELQKKLDRLAAADTRAFMESCAKALAMRLMRIVKMKTPVGQYPKGSGKVGGTLRRGWTASTAEDWADSIDVQVQDGVYTVSIINPVEYASYVEYGHRSRSGGWVPGRFMLTISANELNELTPAILEAKIKKYLGGF